MVAHLQCSKMSNHLNQLNDTVMNASEYICEQAIIEAIPNIVVVDNQCVTLTQMSCYKIKATYFEIKRNVLFKNARTPNLTYKGNNKIIEFRVDLINGKTIWIDAKYLSKTTNISDAVLGDVKRAKTLNGVLWLVFFGEGYTEAVIDSLKEEKHDKVKFIKGEEMLIKKLIQESKSN